MTAAALHVTESVSTRMRSASQHANLCRLVEAATTFELLYVGVIGLLRWRVTDCCMAGYTDK